MVRRAHVQRSLLEVLRPDGDKLWDDELREIDTVLDDEEIVDLVDAALRRRRPKSASRGRLGTPVVVVLRMLVLKHLYDWSFAECEREVRGSLVYRAFCRIDGARVPDAKTLIRLAALLGPEVLKDISARLVHLARERRVVRGHRLRVDTTVVETNIHYPTDSTLLADGMRVLTRTMHRMRAEGTAAAVEVRDRTRSLARRVFEITQRSRKASARTRAAVREQTKARMTELYREAMAITRAVVRQAATVLEQTADAVDLGVQALRDQLKATVGMVGRVLAQTRARVLKGDTHDPDKLLSLFEPQVSPSALAVFLLTTNSNFVGCSTEDVNGLQIAEGPDSRTLQRRRGVRRHSDSLPSGRLWCAWRRRWWRWGLRSCWRFDPFKNWVVDERRIARADERHRIAGVQQHVQVGHFLRKGNEHRSLSGGDLHQKPDPVTLLADDLTFDALIRPADGFGPVRGNQRGASIRQADANGSPDEEGANEDHPSSHGT